MPASQLGLDNTSPGDDRPLGRSPVSDSLALPPSRHPTSVSVIMCVYLGDRRGPVRDAVSSVLAQTHQDLVLRIFVDGPVTDDVRAYLETLADPRVRLQFAAMNQGLAGGLNRLIDESLRDGYDVIARMDADDICYPDRLEKQLAFLDSHPEVAVVGAGCLEFDEDTGEEFLKVLPSDDRTLKRGLVKRTPFVHPTVAFRAKIFAGGTRYRSDPSEDMHLWVDLARYGWTFANLPEPLVRYRVSNALFARRSSWGKAVTELTARLRVMRELCMISPGNVAWTAAYLALRLLPLTLVRRAYRYLRPQSARG
jgi:glycosyltransferase involved in cell wall biosynthesis